MTFLVDSNVWLALSIADHQYHGVCRTWFDSLSEPASAIFCRTTQQALLRLLTNRSILARYGAPPRTNIEAWADFDALANDRRVAFQPEPDEIDTLVRAFSLRHSASTNLWTDAYLAAFAKAGGYTMVTTDRAFHQFEGLDLLVLGG